MIRPSLKITAIHAFGKQITDFLNSSLSLNSEFKERYLNAPWGKREGMDLALLFI
jgi:hypothetical protein